MNPWGTVIVVCIKALAVATIWAATMRALPILESEILRGAVLAGSAGVVVFVGFSFFIHHGRKRT